MITCHCGERFRLKNEFNIHIQLLKPSVPSVLSVEKGWVSKEKYEKALKDYDNFRLNHHIEKIEK